MTPETAIPAETIIAAVQAAISAAQLGIVYYGIRGMMAANRDRARDNQRLEQENQRRHAETMTALQSQGEALAAAAAGIQHLLAARQEGNQP